jgi:hypothetical protein
MAEATLNDVIKRLQTDNDKQFREQHNTTVAVNSLTSTIKRLLQDQEARALRQAEIDDEARKRTAASVSTRTSSSSSSSDEGGLGLGFAFLAPIAATIGNITAFATAFAAATEGLGPAMKDLKWFGKWARFLSKPVTLPASWAGKTIASVFDDIFAKTIKYEEAIKSKFRFNDKAMRWVDEAGKFVKTEDAVADAARLVANAAKEESAFTRLAAQLEKIKIPDSVVKTWERTAKMFSAEGSLGKLMIALKENKWLGKVVRVLRPLAIILSLFDGWDNAGKEMEDRELYFSTYLAGGIGGFVSGAVGSFFGEFFNIIKWGISWVLKKALPDSWTTVDEEGNLIWNRDENMFADFLGGIDDFDFNKLIKEIIQVPFDALGESLDYISSLIGFNGEEKQADAKKSWDDWWSKSKWAQFEDVTTVIADLLFSPINAILNEMERVMTDSPAPEGEGMTAKIYRFIDWIWSLVPNVEQLKTSIAGMLSPMVAKAIGLGEYLPINDETFTDRFADKESDLKDIIAWIDEAQRISKALSADASGQISQDLKDQAAADLRNAQAALEEARQQTADLLSRGQMQGVSQTTINNASNQFENIMIPMSGTNDPSDPVIASTPQ